MITGKMTCCPIAVQEVLKTPELADQIVAIHGILLHGEGCRPGEFMLLPKDGPFDGVGPIPMPEALERSSCLLVEEPGIEKRLGSSGWTGPFLWRTDAIVIGRLRRGPFGEYRAKICDLWLIILQTWLDNLSMGPPTHEMRVVMFPGDRLPPLPWIGHYYHRGCSLVDVFPVPEDTSFKASRQ